MTVLCLTRRQLQVIAGLARGRDTHHIAIDLGIKRDTVRTRLQYAARRLNFRGGTHPQLVHYAYLHGYLDKLTPEPREPIASLPWRETQGLMALTRGLSVAQTAAEIGIARHTANTQRRVLYRHLDARTGAHAVALAWQHGLLTRDPT